MFVVRWYNENMKVEERTSKPALVKTADKAKRSSNRLLWILAVAGVVTLALLIAFVVYLLSPGTPTDRIRDVFIIFMALEGLVIGGALLVLVVQLAVLINLLQHEIRPILDSTTQTVQTLQGTATFLSEHVTEPVIKLNEAVAALGAVVAALKLIRGRSKK